MGHLYRMLNLARHFRRIYDADVTIITRNNKSALDLVNRFEMRVYPIDYNTSYRDEIEKIGEILSKHKPNVICIDLLKRCEDRHYMLELRKLGHACVVAFSDTHQRCEIDADLVFNASIFQQTGYYQHVKGCRYFLGLDYVMLPEGYAGLSKKETSVRPVPKRILVCMGGADHHDLTYRVIKAIDRSRLEFEVDVAVSASFFPAHRMEPFISALSHKTRVVYDADGLSALFANADIAVTAGGTLLIERMCSGVPGITINQLRHQADLASEVMRQGANLDLGIHSAVNMNHLTKRFESLFSNVSLRQAMAAKGRKMVDGNGLPRVAKSIVETVKAC